MFKPVSPKVSFPELEEEILKYWKENHIFEKSIESRPIDKPWTFLDGPPFVTGMPHYGHLLGSIHKDIFGRYWTMKGYRVPRVWGWDGHGLPIENKVEGKLGIKRKKDIEDVVGVKTFIDECKKYVEEISGEWEWYVDHIGRWVDFANAYKTWDTDYMESVMWVFKQMYEKGHIYKGLKVTLYCPHCATPISNFEVAMDADNHKEISDAATTYKYQVAGEKDTYILAWSTTPWNKIVTLALAVNPELTYVKVRPTSAKATAGKPEYYILAKSTLKMLDDNSHTVQEGTVTGHPEQSEAKYKTVPGYGSSPQDGDSSALPQNDGDVSKKVNYEILEEMKGADLIGTKFVPHYDYFPVAPGEKAFEVIGGDFVTAEEGTGVVTIAAYGEEDLIVMKKENVHIEMHLDDEGTIKADVPKFGGMYYLKANKAVNEDLAARGLIYKDEIALHTVPLCWRCHTRLYHAPINAWYVDIQTLKPLMVKTNEQVNWYPKYFKHGRFLKSLENAPDWNISRNRYWGSPVPVWECACGERFVPGSIKELEEAAGKPVKNLHKPDIDEVTVTCKKCGKTAKRVPEVLDSWIEAGSASFAERHYPFAGDDKLEDFYPPDFIAEYTGQIRAWFYVLHVIGAALFQTQAFKNVGVEGVILGTDGRKMSKNLKNYPDPKELLEKFGGDALRLYLMSSPIMHGEDIVISEEQYRNQVRGMMLILWNVYNFFITYATIDGFVPGKEHRAKSTENVLDQWILSLLHTLVKEATESLDGYDTVKVIDKSQKFIDDFSTWYLRRSRDRVGPTAENKEDTQAFYETTYEVLTTLTQILSPITPFLSEAIYRNLTDEESVHLTDWPSFDEKIIQNKLHDDMKKIRGVVEHAHALRKKHSLKVRDPLAKIIILESNDQDLSWIKEFDTLLKDELNVKSVVFADYKTTLDASEKLDQAFIGCSEHSIRFFLDTVITPELKAEGDARGIIREIQAERKNLGTAVNDKVNVILPMWPEAFEDDIKRKTNILTLTKGDSFSVTRVEN